MGSPKGNPWASLHKQANRRIVFAEHKNLSKGRVMRMGLILLSVLATSYPAQAEVLTWDCYFETRTNADGEANEKMHLVFKVDSVSQKAYMEGNAGIVEVTTHVGSEAFSFSEQVGSGAVQTTTITKNGYVVHSRNTVILGEIVAAQHFGECLFN